MHEEDQEAAAPAGSPADGASPIEPTASRRNLLRLAALGGAAVVTVRPGMAQAAASALTCTIPVPDPGNSAKWIRYDGKLVKADSKDSYAGPAEPLKAVDIQNAVNYSTSYPGYSANASSAYTAYIKNLTQGTVGFTCYASIQIPR